MKRILFVDDDADDRLMFIESMELIAPHINCLIAKNGLDALTKIKGIESELPELIFLDLNMPLLDGWGCLAELKANEKYSGIPVIMYSTSSYMEDIERALQNGALCFFTKPLVFKGLQKNLSIIMNHLESNTLELLRGTSIANETVIKPSA
jgi:CheY-like chemotaxis protein